MQLLDLFWAEGSEVLHLASVLGGISLAQQRLAVFGDTNGDQTAVRLLPIPFDEAITLERLEHTGHCSARDTGQSCELPRLELIVDPCGEQHAEPGKRQTSGSVHRGFQILQKPRRQPEQVERGGERCGVDVVREFVDPLRSEFSKGIAAIWSHAGALTASVRPRKTATVVWF